MWPEKDTLLEMVTFLSDIENFVTGRTLNEFVNDDMFRSAVQYKLIIVGEAVTRLSKEFRKAHARIPWQKVADYRNFLHAEISKQQFANHLGSIVCDALHPLDNW